MDFKTPPAVSRRVSAPWAQQSSWGGGPGRGGRGIPPLATQTGAQAGLRDVSEGKGNVWQMAHQEWRISRATQEH